ncbi:glycosyltransferase family 9 protein [Ideonella sp.]|uniref:glycosyltransferase family 9 protein n=1 Tax=Ideonella sp. TaxID=1929293 RepID=UPI0035B03529
MSVPPSPPSAPSSSSPAPGVDARWRGARRVLAVRLDQMGDVVMTTPALHALREALPQAHVTLLTSPSGAALAPCLDAVDAVIAAEVPWMKLRTGTEGARPGDAEAALVARLAAGAFDAAVIFTVCTQSPLPAAMLCRLAGIPLALAHCRENPYALLSHWVRDTEQVADGMRHEVQRQLDLVAHLGGPRPADTRLRLHLRPCDHAAAAAACAAAGLAAGRPYLLVHPGATAASRRWPARRFGEAAERIAQAGALDVVFTGGPGEQPLIDEARAAMRRPAVSLAGQLDVPGLAALVQAARLVLTNNSGPSHLAAAVGTPVVTLYAQTNPQHTPWQARARVLWQDVPCRHCLKSVCPQGHHRCLLDVGTTQVVDAALALLPAAAPGRSEARPPSRSA